MRSLWAKGGTGGQIRKVAGEQRPSGSVIDAAGVIVVVRAPVDEVGRKPAVDVDG